MVGQDGGAYSSARGGASPATGRRGSPGCRRGSRLGAAASPGYTGAVSTLTAALLALLVAAPPADEPPTGRDALLASAGLTDGERQSIERALGGWRQRVGSAEGSAEALACVDRAAGEGPFTPCIELAVEAPRGGNVAGQDGLRDHRAHAEIDDQCSATSQHSSDHCAISRAALNTATSSSDLVSRRFSSRR